MSRGTAESKKGPDLAGGRYQQVRPVVWANFRGEELGEQGHRPSWRVRTFILKDSVPDLINWIPGVECFEYVDCVDF